MKPGKGDQGVSTPVWKKQASGGRYNMVSWRVRRTFVLYRQRFSISDPSALLSFMCLLAILFASGCRQGADPSPPANAAPHTSGPGLYTDVAAHAGLNFTFTNGANWRRSRQW